MSKGQYKLNPDYNSAARAGFRAFIKGCAPEDFLSAGREYVRTCLGAARHYMTHAEDPKPEIVRVLMGAPAMRDGARTLRVIRELPMPALFFELEEWSNGRNQLSPMGREAVNAMQSYERYLDAIQADDDEDDDFIDDSELRRVLAAGHRIH